MPDQPYFANANQKATTMESALNNFGVDSPSDECFDCPTNGKVCGKSIEVGGKTVIYD